jgi:SET domain-containing protein
LFQINSKITIDGRARENIARYINHSCQPNTVADEDAVTYYALRDIQENEELTFENQLKIIFETLIII